MITDHEAMHTIYLNCTDVAVAIGKNKYRAPHEIINKICHDLAKQIDRSPDLIKHMTDELLSPTGKYGEQVESLAREKIVGIRSAPITPSVELALGHSLDPLSVTPPSSPPSSPPSLSSSPPLSSSSSSPGVKGGGAQAEPGRAPPLSEKIEVFSRQVQSSVEEKVIHAVSAGCCFVKPTTLKEVVEQEEKEFIAERDLLLTKFNRLQLLKRKVESIKDIPLMVERAISMKTGVLAEKIILDEIERETQAKISARGEEADVRYKIIPINARWRIVIGGKSLGTYGSLPPPLLIPPLLIPPLLIPRSRPLLLPYLLLQPLQLLPQLLPQRGSWGIRR